jgi:hypothetical protein
MISRCSPTPTRGRLPEQRRAQRGTKEGGFGTEQGQNPTDPECSEDWHARRDSNPQPASKSAERSEAPGRPSFETVQGSNKADPLPRIGLISAQLWHARRDSNPQPASKSAERVDDG